MALRPCPDCKREISTEAAACPQCGYDLKGKRAAQQQSRKAVGCLAMIAVVVIYVATFDSGGSSSPPRDPNLFDALYACEQYTKGRLRSPSTAKFGKAGTTADAVRSLGEGRYKVIGYVDAQNAFGAMIRNVYECDVTVEGGRTNVTDLKMGESR